jgi:hypothetical protein
LTSSASLMTSLMAAMASLRVLNELFLWVR